MAAIVEWTSFALLISVVHLYYLIAVIISFIIATTVNYKLSASFVFMRGRHSVYQEAFLLYVVSAAGLLLNLLLMSLFVGIVHVPAMTAKVVSTGIVFFWNFAARKIWVFAK